MKKITMSVQEVAEILGVSQATIYQMVRERSIPFLKIRSKIMFNKQTIEKWIISIENNNEIIS